MTSFASNTASVQANTFISLAALASQSKKSASIKNYMSFIPKDVTRKSTVKLFSMDWDMNRNELEFE